MSRHYPANLRFDSSNYIGNASLGGASVMLLQAANETLVPLLQECRVVELNQIASFEDNFIDCMPLAPVC